MSNNGKGRLGLGERLGYGVGDTASNFIFQFFLIFLLYYYTDVFGVSAAAVGTMLFVTRFWDAISDPMMGALADRTNTRWGKFRPYILWAAPPFGLMGYLVFAGPDLDPTGKLVWAWVTCTLMFTLYTVINVPYSALMGVMTPSSQERTVLSSFRFVGAFGGLLLISLVVRPLVAYFGGDDEQLGFQITMGIFAGLAVLMFLVTFASTRERVAPDPGETINLANDFKILVQNLPWVVLFFAGILTLTQVALKNAVTIHYFKYYFNADGVPLLGVFDPIHRLLGLAIPPGAANLFDVFDPTTVFLTLTSIFLIIGVACTKLLSDRFEKKTLMIALSLIVAALNAVLFLVPAGEFGWLLVVGLLGAFAAGPTAPLVWAMYGDVADYGEWRFKRRTTGLIFSASMFAQKFGLTIGAGLSAWLLALFGYVANVAQGETSLLGIQLLFTMIPAGISVLNVVALCFYNLSDGQVAEIERELAARKG